MARRAIISAAVVCSDQLLHLINKESDEEDDDELAIVSLAGFQLRLRNFSETIARVGGYVQEIVPRFTHRQFREHFRLTPTAFARLEHKLGVALTAKVEGGGRPRLNGREQLLSTLWLLATPDSFRSVADRFGMGKSLLHDTFVRVIWALSDIAHSEIVWPTGSKLQDAKARFRRFGHLPNVVGAIDGSHIPITEPHEHSISYKTRKMEFAITLQAVCDADLSFIDCFAGYPGSVPDIRVFRNSDLWRNMNRIRRAYFPEEEYIIGDKAYPVLSWCIPPFINRGALNAAQQNFNRVLSQMRQVIERAFALLKGRFRRLKFLDMKRIDLIPYVILACCVLHNICLDNGGNEIENFEDFIHDGLEEEQPGNRNVQEEELLQEVRNEPGEEKRAYLVQLVAD